MPLDNAKIKLNIVIHENVSLVKMTFDSRFLFI